MQPIDEVLLSGLAADVARDGGPVTTVNCLGMSLRGSVLLHDNCLPPGLCMRPASTSAVTSLTRCSLALLPTIGGTETEGKVVPAVVSPALKSGGAADVESSSLVSSGAADVLARPDTATTRVFLPRARGGAASSTAAGYSKFLV